MREAAGDRHNQEKPLNRRQFARRAGSLAAAALLPAAVEAEAQTQLQPDEFTDWPEELPPADRAEVRAKYTNLLRMYGDRLNMDDKKHAREAMIRQQRTLIVVRAIKTENWDDMSTTTKIEELGEQTPR